MISTPFLRSLSPLACAALVSAAALVAACGDDDGSAPPPPSDMGPTDAATGADMAAPDDAAAADDAEPPADASSGGRLVGCVGMGNCATLRAEGCRTIEAMGGACRVTYTEGCQVRGCTGLPRASCGLAGGTMGCIWNAAMERCEEDPVCPTLGTDEAACAARGCSYLRAPSGCTGTTWDCSTLDALVTGVDASGADLGPNPCGNTSDGLPVYDTDRFGLPITCTSNAICRLQTNATNLCDTALRLCVEPCASTATCVALRADLVYSTGRTRACSVPLPRDDAPNHNGTTPTTANWTIPYAGAVGAVAHTHAQAVEALRALGARVIGVNVGSGPGGAAAGVDLTDLARSTETVTAAGMPLVYTGAASTTADQIISGIRSLVQGTPQNVSTRRENVAGNPDMFDATRFIKSFVPFEGYAPSGAPGAMPGVTYRSKDATTFYEVIPGTRVEFTVDFYNDVREPASTAQIFRARIIVVGNGVADLDQREVYIVVPPAGGTVLL